MAATGIYGVVSYHVTRRTHEFGIRVALGAQRREIMANIFRDTGRIISSGTIIGVSGIVALSQVLESFLFEVNTLDTLTLVVSVVFLVSMACSASLLPALRASRVSPLVMLNRD